MNALPRSSRGRAPWKTRRRAHLLLLLSSLSAAHAQPAHLEAIGWDTTRRAFQLRLAGLSDARLRVDYSDDLVTWEFMQALPSQEPPAELSDSQAFRSAHRFYRVLPTEEIVGESKRLGNGTVRSWVRLDEQGNPTGLGVTFSSGALTQLPSSGTEIVLQLPSLPAVPPFDHIGINWNPNGHPPAGVYNRPHFDVHFYLITLEERNLITSTAKMYVAPAPEFLAQDYELSPNSGDSRMGSHWWDAEAAELHGHIFEKTFVFGFYDGVMVFLEPMMTLNYLNTQPAFLAPIKQPSAWQKPGLYPGDYKIDHDPQFEEYTVALTNLVARGTSVSSITTAYSSDAEHMNSSRWLFVSSGSCESERNRGNEQGNENASQRLIIMERQLFRDGGIQKRTR